MAILVVAPEIYDQTLQLPLENRRLTEIIFPRGDLRFRRCAGSRSMHALALNVLADPGGFPVCVLRAPASVLELMGVLPLPVRPGMWCFRPFLACFSPESYC